MARADRRRTPAGSAAGCPAGRLLPRRDPEAFGRLSERIARFIGTGRFLVIQTAVIFVWVIWNVAVPKSLRFDAYPFQFLTLVLSLQAAYAAPLILLAQNRQDDRDRANLAQDRDQNAMLTADAEYITREVASLRVALGDVVTRDFMRAELRALLEELPASGPDGDGDDRGDRPKQEAQATRPAGAGARKTARRRQIGQPALRPEPVSPSRCQPPPEAWRIPWSHGELAVCGRCPGRAGDRHRPGDQPPDHRDRHGQIRRDRRRDEPGGSRSAVYLTTAACPLRGEITTRVTKAVSAVEGVTEVSVVLDVMNDEQRTALRTQLRGNQPEREIPFARPESLTRVYGVASGKGGVGKSSVTVNLAVALARNGLYGRAARRRHLRPQRPAHARPARPRADPGREHADAAPGVRGEGHLDGHVHPGNQPVTWRGPDAAPRAAAVPVRRLLGRPRRPAARPAAGHRRRRHLARPAASRRRRSCWSPPRSWPRPRSPSAPAPSPARPGRTSSASWRTWPTCRARTAASSSTSSARAAARRSPRA